MSELPTKTADEHDSHGVTDLLRRLQAGDSHAGGELFEVLYPELLRCAEQQMRGQSASHTLQATALVNEAFLRLNRPAEHGFENRRHFLLTASRAMRHVLIDHSRGKSRAKREGRRTGEPLDQIVLEDEHGTFDLEALEAAIAKLEERDPAMAKAVELRFFAGLDVAETAKVLGIARRTFDRRWQATRDWLRLQLEGES